MQFCVGLLKLIVRLFTLEFGTSARGENPQCSEVFVGGLHRLGVQYGQVPNGSALRGDHRHPDITFCPDLLQPKVFWKFFLQAARGRANMACRDPLTGCAGESVGESSSEIRSFPERERS